MKAILKKEIKQFFNSLTGLVAIVIFLLLNGLLLFFFPTTNLLDYGFVSLEYFFDITPFTLIFLIAAITMRLFADELKDGTFELLATRPLSSNDIIQGKLFASLLIVVLSLLPTVIYAISLSQLAASEIGFDIGALTMSYVGLLLLATLYISIGLWCSSWTQNSIVAFLCSTACMYVLYDGFEQLVTLNLFDGDMQFILENFGIAYHFRNISKGFVALQDLIYFISCTFFFIFLTKKKLRLNK